MIYLDEAATSKPKQEVIDTIIPYLTEQWYNPSSLYSPAQKIKQDIENARQTVADFIGAKSNEIYFTSGGSESNNWVIQGFINYSKNVGLLPTVITTSIEHKSIIECCDNIFYDVRYIGVDKEGFVNIEQLKKILENNNSYYCNILVSIQFANNEIGTIQDIKKIADLVHEYGAIFHTDAVQAFGHIPINVDNLGIDLLSASGHKIGCPKGIGILYKRSGIKIEPLIYGTQMDSMRGGTENAPYIMGFAKAIEIAKNTLKDLIDVRGCRNILIGRLLDKFKNNVVINGSFNNRLPNNINITFRYPITGEALIYMLDLCGIYVSSGSACNSHTNKPSHVLQAIGLSDEDINRTIRITLPDNIDLGMITIFIDELEKQIKLLCAEQEDY